jgi:uncharacterized membrane protein YhiD involved in acid resistance
MNATNWYNSLTPEGQMVLDCALNMLIGGLLAIYIRELYKRCSSSVSNREQFANIFPMLTLTTVAIIFVVKSSLALSLGLVGALSIVRFRAAIKTPEELVYLFFCIGVGLALGAEHRLLTFVAVAIISVFVIGGRFLRKRNRQHNLLLTVTGDAKPFFDMGDATAVDVIQDLTKVLTIQRFDLEDGHVQFRCTVSVKSPEETTNLMSRLQTKIPQFQVSYVNLDTLL